MALTILLVILKVIFFMSGTYHILHHVTDVDNGKKEQDQQIISIVLCWGIFYILNLIKT